MKPDLFRFFNMQKQIFGVCPNCDEFFRLSDCKVYVKAKPALDWMENLELEKCRLDLFEDRIEERKEELQEKAREKGRHRAHLIIRKIDPLFTPRKLNPDDARVLFHPIDYIVFNGMKKANSIRNLVLLDRETKSSDHRALQRSIEKVIERGNYDWLTLRIKENGSIVEE